MARRVLFIHGLEGHPQGTKVQLLRAQGFDVHAVDMYMSIKRLSRKNSVARNLLRLPETQLAGSGLFGIMVAALRYKGPLLGLAGLGLGAVWWSQRRQSLFREAITQSFERCVQIQAAAVQQVKPEIVVASSWGGAVAGELLTRGIWQGPSILLAPAIERVCARMADDGMQPKLHKLKRCAERAPVLVFHDPTDTVVPHADSLRLERDAGVELRSVDAGGHRLLDLLRRQELGAAIHELLDAA